MTKNTTHFHCTTVFKRKQLKYISPRDIHSEKKMGHIEQLFLAENKKYSSKKMQKKLKIAENVAYLQKNTFGPTQIGMQTKHAKHLLVSLIHCHSL